MALPKMEVPGGRFTLKAILAEIGEKLGALFAPLDLKPPKRKEPEYRGAPGPWDWEETVPGNIAGEEEVIVVTSAKKSFPEKKPKMEPKKMHRPRVQKPEIKRQGARGKLQKNL